jgi:hypothetical protein
MMVLDYGEKHPPSPTADDHTDNDSVDNEYLSDSSFEPPSDAEQESIAGSADDSELRLPTESVASQEVRNVNVSNSHDNDSEFEDMINTEVEDPELVDKVLSTQQNDILFDSDEIPEANDLVPATSRVGVPIDDTDEIEEIARATPSPAGAERVGDDGDDNLDNQTRLRNRTL